MGKKMLVTVLLLLVCIFISNEAFSGWTQPKGHSYNELSVSYYVTDSKYTTIKTVNDVIVNTDSGIRKVDSAKFTSTKISYYGEYGITDKITAIVSVPMDWQESDDTKRWAGENGPSGIGDINLGVRHSLSTNLFGSGVVSSVQLEVKIPEAYKHENPLTHLSLGAGQYDTTLSLLFGRGLGKGYALIITGYKYRFENRRHNPITFKPSDQVKVSIYGGYSIISKLSLTGSLEWFRSVGNADVSDELVRANFPVGGESVHKKVVVIKDTLGLTPNDLNVGIGLVVTITDKIDIAASYNRDVGMGDVGTKDYAFGETYKVSLVYKH